MNKHVKLDEVMREYGLLIIFIVLVIALGLTTPTFRKTVNIINIIKQASVNGILSMGMMIVIITGGIDLSVGSIVGISGVCAALCAQDGSGGVMIPVLAGVGVGLLIGALNGVGAAFGSIPPFIITLGTMSIARGLALVISGGVPVINLSETFVGIASGTLFGIPLLPYYFIAIALVFAFVLNQTVFGRHIYSIGGNAAASKVSGIDVNTHLMFVYMISGICAGIGGVLMAARTSQGSPVMGTGYEMDAVTAVVVGGVSMSGGLGKTRNVVIGALFIAVVENALTIFGVDANWKQVVKGIIIIGAVLLDVKSKGNKS